MTTPPTTAELHALREIAESATKNFERDFPPAVAIRLIDAMLVERGRTVQLAQRLGCLEPNEDGLPSCDPPCIACAALQEQPHAR